MKAILVAAMLAAGPAMADVQVTIPSKRVAEFEAQGGCALVTKEEFEAAVMEMAQKAYEAGKAEAKAMCRNNL
jgi:hypothetical protein